MVVSGYSMDLYCDCTVCKKPKGSFFTTEVTSFGGENFRDCLKQAKKLVGFLKNAIQFVLHQVTRLLNYEDVSQTIILQTRMVFISYYPRG